jgi:hypothetical protein
MLTVNSFLKFNGVNCEPFTAGTNLMVFSFNGLKMTSVRCPLDVNKLKCRQNVNGQLSGR